MASLVGFALASSAVGNFGFGASWIVALASGLTNLRPYIGAAHLRWRSRLEPAEKLRNVLIKASRPLPEVMSSSLIDNVRDVSTLLLQICHRLLSELLLHNLIVTGTDGKERNKRFRSCNSLEMILPHAVADDASSESRLIVSLVPQQVASYEATSRLTKENNTLFRVDVVGPCDTWAQGPIDSLAATLDHALEVFAHCRVRD